MANSSHHLANLQADLCRDKKTRLVIPRDYEGGPFRGGNGKPLPFGRVRMESLAAQVLRYYFPEDNMDDPEERRLMLCVKMKQNSLALADAPEFSTKFRAFKVDGKLEIIKKLVGEVQDLMEMSKLNPSTREKELILAATHYITEVFNRYKNEYHLDFKKMKLDTFVQYFVEIMCKDYDGSDVLVRRYEFACEVLLHLTIDDVLHFGLEQLTVAIKSALNRVHRFRMNSIARGIVNPIDIDTLFKYLALVVQFLAIIPSITESELYKLKSIERTSGDVIPYTVIVFAASRVAIIAESKFEGKIPAQQ